MSDSNPYQAPSSSFQPPVQAGGGDGHVPPAVMQALQQTKPWVTFLAILGFVFTGLMVLGGLGVAVAASMTSNTKFGPGIGLLYVVLGGLYFVPSFFLLRYGSAIRRLLDDGGSLDALSEAMVRQKSFWRLVGISTLVIMCLYFLGIIAVAIMGVMAAGSR